LYSISSLFSLLFGTFSPKHLNLFSPLLFDLSAAPSYTCVVALIGFVLYPLFFSLSLPLGLRPLLTITKGEYSRRVMLTSGFCTCLTHSKPHPLFAFHHFQLAFHSRN
jgi:hypothetical protein